MRVSGTLRGQLNDYYSGPVAAVIQSASITIEAERTGEFGQLFVDAIGTNRFAAPIIRSLVSIARNCNMSVIAEGVETVEQVEYLKALGISAAQGYVFAPPLPAKLYLDLVASMEPLRYKTLVDNDDIDFVTDDETSRARSA